MRTIAIGDIHGCKTALVALVEALELKPEDKLITLGDYIDRGPDSKGVVDYLTGLVGKCELIHLKGNHEQLMERACETRMDRLMWTNVGGLSTMLSYGVVNPNDLPEEHWEFYDRCHQYHETDTHIFVHGGPEPEIPMNEQEEDVLLWIRTNELKPHYSKKVIICGHTPTDDDLPEDMDYAICIDTHAYAGGWLTALDVDSGEYWQSNEEGEVRKKNLKRKPSTSV